MECHKFFEDIHTGDVVCTLCGLVDGKVLLPGWAPSQVTHEEDEVTDLIITLCRLIHANEITALHVYLDSKKKKSWFAKEAFAAACVFLACKQDCVPRTIREIADASGVEIGQLNTYIRRLCEDKNLPPTEPTDFLERFCAGIGYSDIKHAKGILESIRDCVTPRAPETVAAVAIFISYKETRGKAPDAKRFQQVTTVAVQTVRTIKNELFPQQKRRRTGKPNTITTSRVTGF